MKPEYVTTRAPRFSLWLASLAAVGLLPLGAASLSAQTAATRDGGTGNPSSGTWGMGTAPNVTASASGAAYAWGQSVDGELGNGSTSSSFAPTPVNSPLTGGVTAVAGGAENGFAVLNGAVYAWGYNNAGELGNNTTGTQSNVPVPASFLTSGVTAISGGSYNTLAVQNGAAYAWGYNNEGQLGNGTTANSAVPLPVTGLTSGVTAVAGGEYHSLAIQNGAAYAWGYNAYGQVGNGTSSGSVPVTVPVPVSGLTSGVTAIAAGDLHSLAIQNGAAFAWGYNGSGQLGNGTTTNSTLPSPVLTLSTGVTSVSGGLEFSLAVKNGNVYAWGSNSSYQLGNGTNTSSSVPIEVDPTDLQNIKSVVAGDGASYALASDGSLWVWGTNRNGILGLGNNAPFVDSTPQHLLPPNGYSYSAIDANSEGFSVYAILSPSVVPEPSTWTLVAGAILLFSVAVRRRLRRGA